MACDESGRDSFGSGQCHEYAGKPLAGGGYAALAVAVAAGNAVFMVIYVSVGIGILICFLGKSHRVIVEVCGNVFIYFKKFIIVIVNSGSYPV